MNTTTTSQLSKEQQEEVDRQARLAPEIWDGNDAGWTKVTGRKRPNRPSKRNGRDAKKV